MKRLDTFLIIAVILIIIGNTLNATIQISENHKLKEENSKLKQELSESKNLYKLDTDDLKAELQWKETEISYWGRLYDAMKRIHPKDAKTIEGNIESGEELQTLGEKYDN